MYNNSFISYYTNGYETTSNNFFICIKEKINTIISFLLYETNYTFDFNATYRFSSNKK